MRNFMMIVYGILLLGFGASIVWAMFAISKPGFDDRFMLVLAFQGTCLTFYVTRRLRRRS